MAAITVAMTSITTTPSKADSHFSYRTLITDAGRSLSTDGKWIVTCGLPTRENPLIDILASQHELPPTVRTATGHMLIKRLHQPHPDGGLSTEMWIFTPALGDWWRLKAIRVYPDEVEKLTGNVEELTQAAMRGEIRQIVDSPFLPEPLILHGPDAEEEVDAHITGMLRNASGLRCAPTRPGVAGVSDIKRAQRTLARHGHDPGPIDGQMGPRTEAALRAFQTEQGQAPNGQLDEATLERLAAP